MTYGDVADANGRLSDKISFYQNRLARTLPVYYTCTGLAIPLWLAGYGSVDPRQLGAVLACVAVSVLPVSTLFAFMLGSPIDGPGWTIGTLAVMWLLFPYTYPYIRSRSDDQLIVDITNYYWLQLALVLGLFPALVVVVGFWPAFAAATMQPIVRYPVFLMGACAGELCRRRRGLALIWPNSGLGFFPACCCCRVEYDVALEATAAATGAWSARCWTASMLFALVTASVASVDAVVRYQGRDTSSGILGGWWYQAVVPFIQLEIVVSLTRDFREDSVTNHFFRHTISQWLGDLSMCIYLVHWVLIQYLCWGIEGKALTWPDQYDCPDGPERDDCVEKIEHFNNARSIPMWGIPVVMAVSILVAVGLRRLVEVPGRHLLRARRSGHAAGLEPVAGHSSSAFSPVFSHEQEKL